MAVYKIPEFQREQPEVSVILPWYKGTESPAFKRMCKDIREQTLRNFELIVVSGIGPNGHARNLGVEQAQGKYFIFLDDTCVIQSRDLFMKLIEPLRVPGKIAMTGASCQIEPGSSYLQREYALFRTVESPPVTQLTESSKVQHICLAIRSPIYREVGWESDKLITGTDNDLRARLDLAGESYVLVPDASVFYRGPKSWRETIEKSYRKGIGSGYAFCFYPGLFEFSNRIKIRTPLIVFGYSFARILVLPFHLRIWRHPLQLSWEWVTFIGLIKGIFKFRHVEPDQCRKDLRL